MLGIRSAGRRASARRRERLTGGAGRAERARAADRRGRVDLKAGCGGWLWAVKFQADGQD
jgi:hypothetical protein